MVLSFVVAWDSIGPRPISNHSKIYTVTNCFPNSKSCSVLNDIESEGRELNSKEIQDLVNGKEENTVELQIQKLLTVF